MPKILPPHIKSLAGEIRLTKVQIQRNKGDMGAQERFDALIRALMEEREHVASVYTLLRNDLKISMRDVAAALWREADRQYERGYTMGIASLSKRVQCSMESARRRVS